MSDASESGRRRDTWPAVVYVALLVIGIPWYWPGDDYTIVAGMPAWVVIAIVVSAVASAFTAWLLRRPWPAERGADAD